jgi:hypothetical protein
MSRLSKASLLVVLLIFVLACNAVTQPIRDVQDIASTAESFATSLPIETLQALPSAIPVETLQSLPSELENYNYFDPQGEPAGNWKNIPVMPDATAGQEFNDTTYSFKVDATPQEVQAYYETELKNLGWSSTFNMPGDENGAIMVFSKGDDLMTITVTVIDNETIVILTLG